MWIVVDSGRTFSFIDPSGFTALTEAHGDRDAVGIIDRFVSVVRKSLGPDDVLVKTIGTRSCSPRRAPRPRWNLLGRSMRLPMLSVDVVERGLFELRHLGVEYRCCSLECAAAFAKKPEQYVDATAR
jgi:YHS domain-containing protein